MTELDRLKALTAALKFAPVSLFKTTIIPSIGIGAATLAGLLNTGNVAVADAHFKKGTAFPNHTHNELEVLVLYTGQMIVIYKNHPERYTAPETIILKPGLEHEISFTMDSNLIAISIPAISDWPEGSGNNG